MPRKLKRRGEPTETGEDPTPLEGESAGQDDSGSSAHARGRQDPEAEGDQHPSDAPETGRRLSAGVSAQFVFRTACHLAGRVAEKLVAAYTRATALDRNYIADFNKSAGLTHIRRKQWDKAIPLLEKAVAADPDNVEIRTRLAEAYTAQRRYDRASEHLEQVLETAPDSAVALRALGGIRMFQQDYDGAIGCLEKAARLDPDHAQTYYRLGIAYDNKKQYEQAVESFRTAIRADPRLAKAYQALGFTYETMGNRDLAVECFKKALELE